VLGGPAIFALASFGLAVLLALLPGGSIIVAAIFAAGAFAIVDKDRRAARGRQFQATDPEHAWPAIPCFSKRHQALAERQDAVGSIGRMPEHFVEAFYVRS
jgi:hypothetical protein